MPPAVSSHRRHERAGPEVALGSVLVSALGDLVAVALFVVGWVWVWAAAFHVVLTPAHLAKGFLLPAVAFGAPGALVCEFLRAATRRPPPP